MTATLDAEPASRGASDASPRARRTGAETASGLRLAVAGGGTGGHIVPGLHLLAYTRAARSELPARLDDLLWFTSGRPVEELVFGAPGDSAESWNGERVILPLEPACGGAPSKGALVLRTPAAVAQARRALVRHKSDVLLGLGGFTSLPAVLAARSLSIPVALIEINACPGSATRWLTGLSARVFHAWRASVPREARSGPEQGRFAPVRARYARVAARDLWIGPPLGPRFACRNVEASEQQAARAELGFDPERELLLVLGGSQGASALNRFVHAHADAFVARGIQVLHQTGPDKLDQARAPFTGYRAPPYRAIGHIDRVDRALCAATLVLCRGGASTLAEVAALRRPAVVVPYPHHADRHQERNARELGRGVRIVDEARVDTSLRDELIALCGAAGQEERERMSAALATAIPSDGAARLYAELVALKESRRGIAR